MGKTGVNESSAISSSVTARIVRFSNKQTKHACYELAFPQIAELDNRLYPQHIYADVKTLKGGSTVELALTVVGKPAVRLPESYWLSFGADDIIGLVAEKLVNVSI